MAKIVPEVGKMHQTLLCFCNQNPNQNSLEAFFSCLFFSGLDEDNFIIFQPIFTILIALERGDLKLKLLLNRF